MASHVSDSGTRGSSRSYAVSGTVSAGAPEQRCITDGRLKLIQYLDGSDDVELYDLERDPTEQEDIAVSMPDAVKEGLRLLEVLWI